MDKLLDSAPCGFVSFRDDGTIVHINHTLKAWLEYSDVELVGKRIDIILAIASRIFYSTHFFPLLKLYSKAEEIFITLATKSKQHIPVLTNSVRKNEGGEFITTCVMIQVHQRQKYENEILNAKREAENALLQNKQLEELRKSLETRTLELDTQFRKLQTLNASFVQFGKIISHDLQEPIHKIQVYTDIVKQLEGQRLEVKSKSALEKINNAASHLKNLTSSLQQYVALEDENSVSKVNLQEIFEHGKLQASNKRNFIDFDLEVEAAPIIDGYSRQLALMFYHLIDNSIQFRKVDEKLKITITNVVFDDNIYKVTRNSYKFVQHIKLIYRDNGIGFEPQYTEYIFEPLKKINAGAGGLGIGMSLIKKIIDNHSGTIHVESNFGEGTTFNIILPVALQK